VREITRGLVFASLALFTVLAGLMLALSENRNTPAATRTPGQPAPTETLYVPSPVVATGTLVDAFALLQTLAPAVSATPCTPPAGWAAETVTSGDTLVGMAARSGVSLAAVLQANCLSGDSTFTGAVIYLPLTTPTLASTAACGPPLGWVFYAVRAGDTLFALSLRYGVAIYDLRQANCLPGVSITVGQNLYVPSVIVNPSTATNTPVPTATLTSTVQPSATLIASATTAPTVAATATTAAPSPTASETATATATATETATVAADTETATSAPSDTATATATETATTTAP
jgi:peptidoglycan-N-acetylglucosamine deacetylase